MYFIRIWELIYTSWEEVTREEESNHYDLVVVSQQYKWGFLIALRMILTISKVWKQTLW